MGGLFHAWILALHDEDALRLPAGAAADLVDPQAFEHEAVQQPEPYFGDGAAAAGASSASDGHLIVRLPHGSERHVIVRMPDGSEADADVIQVGQPVPGFGGLVLEHYERSSTLDEEGRPYLVAVLAKAEH